MPITTAKMTMHGSVMARMRVTFGGRPLGVTLDCFRVGVKVADAAAVGWVDAMLGDWRGHEYQTMGWR